MLEERNFQSLNIPFHFVGRLIDLSTGQNKTAPMMKLHLRYGEIVADVTRNRSKRSWSEEEVNNLEKESRRV